MRKALADYTPNQGGGGSDPTVDKGKLVTRIHEIIVAASEFLGEHKFSLDDLVNTQKGAFEQLSLLQDVTNAMCETLEIKKTYQTYASEPARLMKYANRNDADTQTRSYKDAIIAI